MIFQKLFNVLLLSSAIVSSACLGMDLQDEELFTAVNNDNVERAKELLDAGANVNARDWRYFTPLHCAAERGNVAIAQLLLEEGADAASRNGTGQTPERFADRSGHQDLAFYLKNIRQALLDADRLTREGSREFMIGLIPSQQSSLAPLSEMSNRVARVKTIKTILAYLAVENKKMALDPKKQQTIMQKNQEADLTALVIAKNRNQHSLALYLNRTAQALAAAKKLAGLGLGSIENFRKMALDPESQEALIKMAAEACQ